MFEYDVRRYTVGWKGYDYATIKDELNELGRQGWRVVGNHDVIIAGNVPSEIVIILERVLS